VRVKLSIQRAGIERLDELAPLWAQMQSHHESVASATLTRDIAPFRDRDGSWKRRRALYEGWFAAGTAVLHVAEDASGRIAGYAMVRLGSVGWAQLATPEAMAEIESLSVGRDHRGRGLGSRLIAAVHADLRERGIELLTIAVFAGNEPAARLYARFGMQPVLTTMIGRVPDAGLAASEGDP
jgi:ribosomal protein S18 acetylase RimI-like enzyme